MFAIANSFLANVVSKSNLSLKIELVIELLASYQRKVGYRIYESRLYRLLHLKKIVFFSLKSIVYKFSVHLVLRQCAKLSTKIINNQCFLLINQILVMYRVTNKNLNKKTFLLRRCYYTDFSRLLNILRVLLKRPPFWGDLEKYH